MICFWRYIIIWHSGGGETAAEESTNDVVVELDQDANGSRIRAVKLDQGANGECDSKSESTFKASPLQRNKIVDNVEQHWLQRQQAHLEWKVKAAYCGEGAKSEANPLRTEIPW